MAVRYGHISGFARPKSGLGPPRPVHMACPDCQERIEAVDCLADEALFFPCGHASTGVVLQVVEGEEPVAVRATLP